MAKVALIYDKIFLRHETGSHPENGARVEHTYEYLKSLPLFKDIQSIPPRAATKDEITLAHTEGYYETLVTIPKDRRVALDPDTIFGPGTLEAALFAAGAVIVGIEGIVRGDLERAFCLVRPPGHHARKGLAMGFCIFNNIAIGALKAIEHLGFERAAIVDIDVHHGNGTQEIFYDDPRVLYCSIHQAPFYPGTGSKEERGSGAAVGKTVNVPLSAGSTESDYLASLDEIILPALIEHLPDIVFISAGFDAHRDDPIGGMRLDSTSFGKMTQEIVKAAKQSARGRIVSALEGGYDLTALATSIEAHVEALMA